MGRLNLFSVICILLLSDCIHGIPGDNDICGSCAYVTCAQRRRMLRHCVCVYHGHREGREVVEQ